MATTVVCVSVGAWIQQAAPLFLGSCEAAFGAFFVDFFWSCDARSFLTLVVIRPREPVGVGCVRKRAATRSLRSVDLSRVGVGREGGGCFLFYLYVRRGDARRRS